VLLAETYGCRVATTWKVRNRNLRWSGKVSEYDFVRDIVGGPGKMISII